MLSGATRSSFLQRKTWWRNIPAKSYRNRIALSRIQPLTLRPFSTSSRHATSKGEEGEEDAGYNISYGRNMRRTVGHSNVQDNVEHAVKNMNDVLDSVVREMRESRYVKDSLQRIKEIENEQIRWYAAQDVMVQLLHRSSAATTAAEGTQHRQQQKKEREGMAWSQQGEKHVKVRLDSQEEDADVNTVAQVVRLRDQLGLLSQENAQLRERWMSILREWYLDTVFSDLPREDMERYLERWTTAADDGNELLEKFYRRSMEMLFSTETKSNGEDKSEQAENSSPVKQLRAIGALSRRVGMGERLKHTKPIIIQVQLAALDEISGPAESPNDANARWVALRMALDEWLHRVTNHNPDLRLFAESSNRTMFEIVSGNEEQGKRVSGEAVSQRKMAKKVLAASSVLSVVVLLGMMVYLSYEEDKLHEQEKRENDVLAGKQAAKRLDK